MKIMLADASPLYRQGIQVALSNSGIMVDLLTAESFDQLQTGLAQQVGAVVVILDARLPGLECINELQHILRRPETRVLMLTDNKDVAFMRWALFNGIHGVVAKTALMNELGDAIHTVLEGRIWRYAEEVGLDQWGGQQTRLGYALRRLSVQENNVLKWVRCGLRNKQIADEMSLTEHTIKTHMSNILRKLEIENRTQLVVAVQKIEVSQLPSLSA